MFGTLYNLILGEGGHQLVTTALLQMQTACLPKRELMILTNQLGFSLTTMPPNQQGIISQNNQGVFS